MVLVCHVTLKEHLINVHLWVGTHQCKLPSTKFVSSNLSGSGVMMILVCHVKKSVI